MEAANKRRESSHAPMAECLALELLLAFRKEGSARQKRERMHAACGLDRTMDERCKSAIIRPCLASADSGM